MIMPRDLNQIPAIGWFTPALIARERLENDKALSSRCEKLVAAGAAVDWDEERTRFQSDLLIRGETFRAPRVFDVPASPVQRQIPHLEGHRVSSGGFHYYDVLVPAAQAVTIAQGRRSGHCWFTSEVTVPVLAQGFPGDRIGTDGPGRVWMSYTPMEILTQRSGVRAARGTVLVGGLGMGWFLRRVCSKRSVRRVIVVEKEVEIMDWIGPRIRALWPELKKVTDWLTGDVYDEIGKHGTDPVYLLDIWRTYRAYDRRFELLRSRIRHLWGWGQF